MALDMSVDLISATVQLEQPLGDGTRTVGTGFLISDPAPDGTPRVVLVTAHRRENFGRPLEQICLALRDIAER